ncbi:MAG: ATP-dependent helicase HrpB [Kofleriaceae bacterium]
MPLPPLPIDSALPALLDAVRAQGVAVLVAPPGAGKTTRVPGALLDAGLVEGEVVVLQPRRLAARLAAARVAAERGGRLGDEVGYEVRFDRQVGADTRLRFVTEGILTRRLASDPALRGCGAVIIDEFHERHLDGDLALALVQRLRARRPELRVIVMSATLDAEPVAAYLGAPVVRSEGRAFPVEIEHATLAELDDGGRPRPLGRLVSAALRRVLKAGPAGDVLVFLPGAGEIRRVGDDLAELAAHHDLAVVPLHGDLSADEQDRAVGRHDRRKVILATNVAETSVTIDGVTAVIDAGLARIARQSPWSGLASLQVEPISQASAAQRAGRAGRTAPGRCLRLYTRADHDGRRAFDAPEIARADLAEVALQLRAGGTRVEELAWFEPPPAAAVVAAEALLERLGAVDAGGVTARGRALLRLPAHPRAARIVLACADAGLLTEGALIAAALGARELRTARRGRGGAAHVASASDLLDDVDAMLDARDRGLRPDALRAAGLDPGTARQVDRAARQLERAVGGRAGGPAPSSSAVDEQLLRAILAGFPDRVGRRRAPRSAEIVFADGGAATLAPTSAVVDAEWLVAVDAAETGERGQRGRATIRRASAIEPSWLLDLDLERVADVDELAWSPARARVERRRQLRYGTLVLDESSADAAGVDGASALLARAALAAGLGRFVDDDALATWRARLALVAAARPELGLVAPDEAGLAALLAAACEGLTSFAELARLDLLALLDGSLGEHRAALARLAPTHVALPRRRVAVNYPTDGSPPWIASRMQDFFGLARGPAIVDGRVPLVLHLLAPNQRAVQVTQDLPGFWARHYPGLRNQLARRYPRHAWPDDPLTLIAE